ncbi:hypothetical protein [Streptomyces sp. H27-H5]|uniref:hypothetical protein n=1 Tax=Streptomyces sp. H27-H5 TaxID=2996460 RepID=UPI00226FB893|nr:hypothetical protein [Streptomyces sp. H27-H5]MCY0959966.1 hypothetical protein [Streptomyces sp. H27-H5]
MNTEADRLIAAVNEALATPTAYRDPTPIPAVGPTPPVAQPGRPPMSQRATDASAFMLAAGAATVPPGLIAIGLLVASDYANPTVIAMICAAPAVIAVPVLAIARLLARAKEVMPAEQHNYYSGPVHQENRTVNAETRGLFAKTINRSN